MQQILRTHLVCRIPVRCIPLRNNKHSSYNYWPWWRKLDALSHREPLFSTLAAWVPRWTTEISPSIIFLQRNQRCVFCSSAKCTVSFWTIALYQLTWTASFLWFFIVCSRKTPIQRFGAHWKAGHHWSWRRTSNLWRRWGSPRASYWIYFAGEAWSSKGVHLLWFEVQEQGSPLGSCLCGGFRLCTNWLVRKTTSSETNFFNAVTFDYHLGLTALARYEVGRM